MRQQMGKQAKNMAAHHDSLARIQHTQCRIILSAMKSAMNEYR